MYPFAWYFVWKKPKWQYRCPRSGNLSRCSMNYTGKPVYETHPAGV